MAILGVDEHTAVTIDLGDGRVTVAGRGALTVRRHGAETRLPAGSVTGLPGFRTAPSTPSGLPRPPWPA